MDALSRSLSKSMETAAIKPVVGTIHKEVNMAARMRMSRPSSSSSGYLRLKSLRPNTNASPLAISNCSDPSLLLPSDNEKAKKNRLCREEEEAEEEGKRSEMRGDPITRETLDGWINDSISDIVRNIGEGGSFLVRVFSLKDGGGGGGLRLEKEAATPDCWHCIRRRWDQEGSVSRSPDCIILVQELKFEDEKEGEDAAAVLGGAETRRWGLVVQGRGMGCAAAACYVLSTCRAGLCTHFCLVRAQCGGDSLGVQLSRAWLLPDGRDSR